MIKSIDITGYRLLDEFSADLGDLTVIIGANATGKSTLLDFLQVISQCMENSLNTVLSWHMGMASLMTAHGGSNQVSWKLHFEKPRQDAYWGELPIKRDECYTYEVVLAADKNGQVSPRYETLRKYEAHEGFDEPFKYLEVTPYRSNVYNWKSHESVPFDEAIPESGNENAVRLNETVSSQSQAIINDVTLRLSQMRFLHEFPVPSACRILLRSMAFYTGFEVGKFAPLKMSPAEIRPFTTLDPDGKNLGTVLHEILTRYDFRMQADEIREYFKTAYPHFEEISAETAIGAPARVTVRIREKGFSRPMELWDLSDGMLRFLCLAVALLNPMPPSLIAVDEPEAGLHPKLLPIVADMIKSASERTQVLVTTHSPDLLSHFDIEDVAVLTRDETRTKWHRPRSRETLVQMLKGVSGDMLGDLLRSGELEGYE